MTKLVRSLGILAPLAVCMLLAGWVVISAANIEAASFSLVGYALANLIVYTDAIDFMLRQFMRRRSMGASREDAGDLSIDLEGQIALEPAASATRPYAIIASIYNLEDQLEEFMTAYAPYRERVWLISDGSTDNTVKRLRLAGWRVHEDGVNRRKPAAIRRLLEQLPGHIETVMVIDPDIRIRSRSEGSAIDLERLVSDFQRSGAAAVCPRIQIEPDGFLARFQAFEYALSFRIGRASLADFSITSGVSVYRRSALAEALRRHTLSVYAEDFENAILLLSSGESIYYDGRLVVSTEGPGLVRRWFSQRVGWYYGLLKVYTERFGRIWKVARRSPFAMYHFVVYIGGLTLALHLLKMLSAALLLMSFLSGFELLFLSEVLPKGALINPAYFTAAIGSYLALGVIALFTVVPRAERAYIAPVVPLYLFYAITHIAPMTIGYLNWVFIKLMGRRMYRDHYEPSEGGPIDLPERQIVARRPM